MTVLGSLEVDGAVKVQLTNDDTRAKIEVVVDDSNKLVGRFVGGSVRVDVDRQGLSNTNGVRKLDKSTASKTSSDERLGDPATDVGSRAVDLGEILAGESTTTVSSPATVGVDNDLAASETGITLGTTNDEETRGLDLFALVSQMIRVELRYSFYLRGRWCCRRGTSRESPS